MGSTRNAGVFCGDVRETSSAMDVLVLEYRAFVFRPPSIAKLSTMYLKFVSSESTMAVVENVCRVGK